MAVHHLQKHNRTFIVGIAYGLVLLSFGVVWPYETQAVPAFARKYNVTCHVCHTRPPRLNPYGERFLENGYQLPGTEDGGIIGKKRLGDLTLDDVNNFLAFRLRGNVLRSFEFAKHSPGPGVDGRPEDKTELAFPEIFSIYATGTLTTNVGFFVELESNLEEEETGVERGFLSFNNLYLHDLAHIRIGKFDPSAFSSYPTLRQHLQFVGADTASSSAFAMPVINRIALMPAAFASKFSGIFTRDGTAILSTDPSLYHAVAETGIDIHGRPFGDWFLYQVGILNGANEPFGDSNKPKDWYVMLRMDHAEDDLFSASVSGFAYFGSNNAKVASGADVNWNRYGVAATVRYRMFDLYGAYVVDRLMNLPGSLASSFDTTATGFTVQADALVTDRLLASIRFDHLDAGGLLTERVSNSILAIQGKYYLRTNIALFLRDDINLRDAQGGTQAARNFRNAFLAGVDVVF